MDHFQTLAAFNSDWIVLNIFILFVFIDESVNTFRRSFCHCTFVFIYRLVFVRKKKLTSLKRKLRKVSVNKINTAVNSTLFRKGNREKMLHTVEALSQFEAAFQSVV